MSKFSRSVLGWFLLVLICLLWHPMGYGQSLGDLPMDEPPTVAESDEAGRLQLERGQRPTISVRLPRYFAGIVDQQQRSVIQAIQLRYRHQIEALEKELESLRGQQLHEMEAVLTESQLKLLNQKREQARLVRSIPRMERDGELDQDRMGESSTQ